MPRFSGEPSRKSHNDTIQKMKRLLASAISRHATLQHENQQLHQEFQLLQAVCGALDWLRQRTGEDEDVVNTAEELLLLQQVGLEAGSPPQPEPPDAAALHATTDGTHAGSPQGTATALPAAPRQHSACMSNGSGDSSCSAGSGEAGPGSSVEPMHNNSSSQLSSWSAPTAAPADDAMQLFRRIWAMPAAPNAEAMTAAELLSTYTGLVKQLSLSCQLYEAVELAGSSRAAPQLWQQGQGPVQQMEDTMCSWFRVLVLLFKVKRQDLVQEVCLMNCESGQFLQEPVREHYAWVMPQLGLTTEQQQRIATGVRVFKRILTPSLEELRQLQLEDNAAIPAAPGQQQQQQHSNAITGSCDMQVDEDAGHGMHHTAQSGAATTAFADQDPAAEAAAAAGPATLLEAAAAGGAAMSAVFAPLSSVHVAYRQRLDAQERRSARINTLLRKDFLHRICFCGYVYGCLSWPQQAKLHCLMWPYIPMVLITSETIAQMAPQGPPRRPRGRPRQQPRPQ